MTPELTPKEKEILELLNKGESQQSIAYKKGWHLNTVHTIVADLKIKFDADNLFQLGVKYNVFLHMENKAA